MTTYEAHARVLIDAQLAEQGWDNKNANAVRYEAIVDAERLFDQMPESVQPRQNQLDLLSGTPQQALSWLWCVRPSSAPYNPHTTSFPRR